MSVFRRVGVHHEDGWVDTDDSLPHHRIRSVEKTRITEAATAAGFHCRYSCWFISPRSSLTEIDALDARVDYEANSEPL